MIVRDLNGLPKTTPEMGEGSKSRGWRRATVWCFGLTLPILASCRGTTNPTPSRVESQVSEFSALFREVDSVSLDRSAIVAMISNVAVASNGDIAVLDGKEAFLFSGEGALRRVLSPTACNPEGNWLPRRATFLEDGSLVVSTSSTTYLFDENGDCVRSVEALRFAKALCSTKGRNVFGYYADPRGFRVVEVDLGRDLSVVHQLPDPELRLLAMNLSNGNEIACSRREVHLIFPEMRSAESVIPARVRSPVVPAYYQRLSGDISVGGSALETMRSMNAVMLSGTMASAVLAVDDSTQLFLHSNVPMSLVDGDSDDTGTGITVTTWSSGQVSIARSTVSPALFRAVAARDGRVYFSETPEIVGDEVGNPALRVFALVLEA